MNKRPKTTLGILNKQMSPAKESRINQAAIVRAQDLIHQIRSEIMGSLNSRTHDSAMSHELEKKIKETELLRKLESTKMAKIGRSSYINKSTASLGIEEEVKYEMNRRQ